MTPSAPSRGKVAAAFAIVYVIWGSTYLAILYAIETLPPLLMAAARFFLAGGLLFAWARSRGVPMPTRRQWRACAVAGLLMLMAGNGAVVWAETRIASGVAALIVAIVPCWMVLFEWLSGGERPTGRVVAGLGLGLLGLGLLAGPAGFMGGGRIDLVGGAELLLGGFAWAGGWIFARGHAFSAPRISTAPPARSRAAWRARGVHGRRAQRPRARRGARARWLRVGRWLDLRARTRLPCPADAHRRAAARRRCRPAGNGHTLRRVGPARSERR